MPPNSAIRLAKWEVMWVVIHRGEKHIKVIECDHSLPEALRIYDLAKKGGRKMVTLRSKNVGFPPPPKYRDKMRALNAKGIWWCPYCMSLRKFELRQGFETYTGIWVSEKGYYCQMCDIGHRNHHVSKYNPMSQRIEYSKRSRGSNNKKRGKRGRR